MMILSFHRLFTENTILIIFVNFCLFAPGLILSGEYPKKKSLFNLNPDAFSKIGAQYSSVQPG